MKTYDDNFKMKGEWDFLISTTETQKRMREILESAGRDAYQAFIQAGIASGLIKHVHYSNIIPTVSRQQVAKAITGNIATITEIKVTHQELGTGTTTPANGDTGLQTPSAGTRKSISSMAYSANQMNFTSFWAATEATGTWREFCLFINGTGTSNSGTVLNRVAINITVGSSDALTIDGTVTIS